jgi:hypothetical protein
MQSRIAFREFASRTSPDGTDDIPQLGLNNVLAELLMRQPKLLKIVVVKEMAEWAVTDIVEQRRNS